MLIDWQKLTIQLAEVDSARCLGFHVHGVWCSLRARSSRALAETDADATRLRVGRTGETLP